MDNFLSFNLLTEPGLVIELIKSKHDLNNSVCVTFTPHSNVTLDGYGFGGNYLLAQGLDIIAIKTSRDDWYQSIDLDVISPVRESLDQYAHKYGYGSSMGAYALLAFSDFLKLDKALLVSPQFSIWEDFDTRWSSWASAVVEKYKVTKTNIHGKTKYFVLYDNKSLDQMHVNLINNEISSENLRLVPISYSGHPSINYLNETELLKVCVSQFLESEDLNPQYFYKYRKRSSTYLMNLSLALVDKSKYRSATMLIDLALGLSPNSFILSKVAGDINFIAKNYDQSISYFIKSVDLAPTALEKSHLLAHLSAHYLKLNDREAALKSIREAVTLSPNEPYFLLRLQSLGQ